MKPYPGMGAYGLYFLGTLLPSRKISTRCAGGERFEPDHTSTPFQSMSTNQRTELPNHSDPELILALFVFVPQAMTMYTWVRLPWVGS